MMQGVVIRSHFLLTFNVALSCLFRLYIIYQATLFITSILGPGTIFLLIVGAVQITLIQGYDTLDFFLVLIPFVIFLVVALTTKTKTQVLLCATRSIYFRYLTGAFRGYQF